MVKLNPAEIETLLPTYTLRDYVERTNYEFTSAQYAALVYHSDMILVEKHDIYDSIRRTTDDEELKKQITVLLDEDELEFKAFTDNLVTESGAYVYQLIVFEEDDDEVSYGLFTNFDAAFQFARELEWPFKISKVKVWHNTDEAKDDQHEVGEGDIFFNDEGDILSMNVHGKNEYIMDYKHFSIAIFDMPYPLKKGNIVGVTETGVIGVVLTTPEEFKERIEAKKRDNGRWWDMDVSVMYLHPNGALQVTDFELFSLETIRPIQNDNMDKLVMLVSEFISTGKLPLDYFTTILHKCYEEAQDSCVKDWDEDDDW